jgi:nitroimidazol reductase NimA-like FMN-containing flavoprotein (pyridoxamine 5'-phosphate oxidase superfamily)
MPDSAPLPVTFAKTPRSRIRRLPKRGHYDRETVFAILDAAIHCHVGYAIDGLPYVTPTLFWRGGEHLYWHGSSASRMLRTQRDGIPVCLTVSHIDGLVVARSGFHHSLNYRAVMVFGNAAIVTDPVEKEAKLNNFLDRLYPGRSGVVRAISGQELKATMLMSMKIEEVSAKVREGGPVDDDTDHDADCWAGIIPIVQRLGAPIPDQNVPARGDLAAEAGHFVEGAALDKVLLTLAQREG